MRSWMRQLADHYARTRERYPDDRLLIAFDIDGTILDMRHMIRDVLQSFDRRHGSDWFRALALDDITVHENQVERLLADLGLPDEVRHDARSWYRDRIWGRDVILAAHRPFQGVLDVIRWFQIQPDSYVGINSGRPDRFRRETSWCLNALGAEYRVEFAPELVKLKPGGWEEEVAAGKVAALAAFRAQGYRPFAVVDNESSNIEAMARSDDGEILFLHADTLYESKRRRTPRTVRGSAYDLTALLSEHDLPQRVQLVWHGVNDAWNLSQFLASPVHWGECDVRRDPVGRLVLRHDSFEHRPWSRDEQLMTLAEALAAFDESGKGVKLDLKEGGDIVEEVLALIDWHQLDDGLVWFNGQLETLHEAGFRLLAAARPGAVLQCPVGFLSTLVVSAPDTAREILEMLRGWGVNRFSIGWGGDHSRLMFDRLDRWGYDVNIYAVPDLTAFLQAALLLPRSLTADFNFPQWRYFGRGSGAGGTRVA